MHSCDQCGTTFTRKSNLTRHKNSRYKPVSTVKSSGTTEPTLVAAAAAVKESSLKNRPKNPRIQALLDEIVNDDDSKRHVPPPQVIHKGFSIIPPTTTTTTPSRYSKSSRRVEPRSQPTLTTREEPGMKKIKL